MKKQPKLPTFLTFTADEDVIQQEKQKLIGHLQSEFSERVFGVSHEVDTDANMILLNVTIPPYDQRYSNYLLTKEPIPFELGKMVSANIVASKIRDEIRQLEDLER